jgi:hypothetical protein
MLGQMNAEAQAVEEGAGAQHAIMPGTRAGGVGRADPADRRDAAYNGGEPASTSNPSRTDDSNFHVKSAIAKLGAKLNLTAGRFDEPEYRSQIWKR